MLVQNLGMGAMIGNAGLVRKVAFPREVLVFAQVGHGIVQFSHRDGAAASSSS